MTRWRPCRTRWLRSVWPTQCAAAGRSTSHSETSPCHRRTLSDCSASPWWLAGVEAPLTHAQHIFSTLYGTCFLLVSLFLGCIECVRCLSVSLSVRQFVCHTTQLSFTVQKRLNKSWCYLEWTLVEAQSYIITKPIITRTSAGERGTQVKPEKFYKWLQ